MACDPIETKVLIGLWPNWNLILVWVVAQLKFNFRMGCGPLKMNLFVPLASKEAKSPSISSCLSDWLKFNLILWRIFITFWSISLPISENISCIYSEIYFNIAKSLLLNQSITQVDYSIWRRLPGVLKMTLVSLVNRNSKQSNCHIYQQSPKGQ